MLVYGEGCVLPACLLPLGGRGVPAGWRQARIVGQCTLSLLVALVCFTGQPVLAGRRQACCRQPPQSGRAPAPASGWVTRSPVGRASGREQIPWGAPHRGRARDALLAHPVTAPSLSLAWLLPPLLVRIVLLGWLVGSDLPYSCSHSGWPPCLCPGRLRRPTASRPSSRTGGIGTDGLLLPCWAADG